MKRLKHKRAVLAVLALLSLAVSFQPLGAYERGYFDSFLLALLLMAGVRERLETGRVPGAMAGTPIALIMAGIMSLSFMAFKGMV